MRKQPIYFCKVLPRMEKNYIPIDLHCHSTYSDGSLSVREVLSLAAANGAKYQALTDHDTVAGINEAQSVATELGLTLIPGVEISVTWQGNTLIHIVGLGIDPNNQQLITQLAQLRGSRIERGQRISDNLAKAGIYGAFAGAMALCAHPEALSRTHFSQWLVASGHAKPGKAFDKFLAPGKPGFTQQTWASLAAAVTWIKDSGGVAVIAHPARYGFTRTKLIKLIDEFKAVGGQGIELISSSHSLQDEANIANLCRVSGLLASVGSDFHQQDGLRKILPGSNKALPAGVAAIFPLLGIEASVPLDRASAVDRV